MGQTDEKYILMDEFIPLGDTHYVFSVSKFVLSTIFNIIPRPAPPRFYRFYLQISLIGQKYLSVPFKVHPARVIY